ncbi:MAG: mannose-6-phosphate isomerase, class I [Candidatus Nanopelagicales bacterium]
MLILITNDPRPYAWGSTSAIAALLGRPESGLPEAELWLGAHPGSPARILDPAAVGGYQDLAAWIKAEPEAALGSRLASTGRLPFLLKILAAAAPLSLQAHPTPDQAAAGFERENLAGIPVDAPNRNYRDPHHKPEILVALSDRFEALCGFLPTADIQGILHELRQLDATAPHPRPDLLDAFAGRLDAADPLPETVSWLLGGSEDVESLVAHVVRLAVRASNRDQPGAVPAAAFETVRQLARDYPADPGVIVGLLVHRVSLVRGQALFLPAGNIHAYLQGLGLEVMAASDNVLRGGLTSKHIDVPELLDVLDFSPIPVPFLIPEEPTPGVRVFRPAVPDFVLLEVTLKDTTVELPIHGPAVVLSTAGQAELVGHRSSTALRRGEACYATPEEERLRLRGAGEFFIATPGVIATTP